MAPAPTVVAADQTRPASLVTRDSPISFAPATTRVNFWDSADQYGSHTYMREALKSVPREKVIILSKTNSTDA